MPGLEVTTGKIRFRVKDPGLFREGSFRTKSVGDGISIIMGKLRSGGDSMVAQSYLFDRKTWDREKAKKWIQSHVKKEWKIEDINKEDIGLVDDDALYSLRNRLKQMHVSEFYEKAELVIKEMDDRKLSRWNSVIDSVVKERVEKRKIDETKKVEVPLESIEKVEQPAVPLVEWSDYEDEYHIVLYVEGQRAQKINEYCQWISVAELSGVYYLYSEKMARFVGMIFYKRYGWTLQNAQSAMTELLGQKYYSTVGLDGKINPDIVEKKDFNKELEEGNLTIVSFSKVDEEERIVTGIVYLPDEVDSHGDFMKESTIRKMMITWMLHYQTYKLQHSDKVSKAQVVECFLAPVTYASGTTVITKGAWLLSSKVNDDKVWDGVKSGKITGYSIGGWGKRVEM